MYLERIHIRGFAGLENLELNLEEACCYLEAPNSWGKTSLFNFIVTALYGFPRRGTRSGGGGERENCRPRHTADYGGSLWFQHGGRGYRLDCRWGAQEREDHYSLAERTTGQLLDLAGQLPGPYLLGLDRESLALSLAVDTDAASPLDFRRFEDLLLGRLLGLPGERSLWDLQERARLWRSLLGRRRKASLGRSLQERYLEAQHRSEALAREAQLASAQEREEGELEAEPPELWKRRLQEAEETALILRRLERLLGCWTSLGLAGEDSPVPAAGVLPRTGNVARRRSGLALLKACSLLLCLLAVLGLLGQIFRPQLLAEGLRLGPYPYLGLALSSGLVWLGLSSLGSLVRRPAAPPTERLGRAERELKADLAQLFSELQLRALQRGPDYPFCLQAQTPEELQDSLQLEWRQLEAWRRACEAQLLRRELYEEERLHERRSLQSIREEQRVVQDELLLLRSRFARLENLDAGLREVETWLEMQEGRLKSIFLPRLTDFVNMYYRRYLGADEASPELLWEDQGRPCLRRAGQVWKLEQLSRSERQILSCFLRLALTELLGEKEGLPFFVDDHFVHLDAANYRALLQLLRERLEAGGLSQLLFLSWRPSPL